MRTILEAAVKPKLGLGTQLAAIGRSLGGLNIEIRRDPTPVKPAKFA
jgi:antitoxin FitA